MFNIKKKEKYINFITHAGIITFLMYFFVVNCPLIVFDTDDWIE